MGGGYHHFGTSRRVCKSDFRGGELLCFCIGVRRARRGCQDGIRGVRVRQWDSREAV